MEWKELAVTVSTPAVEAVAELFYQAGCTGVVIEDENVLREYIQSGVWDYHDFKLPEISDVAVVKGYFAADEFFPGRKDELEKGLRGVLDYFPDAVIRLNLGSVREKDWATAWKAFFKPVKVGKRIVIKPSWENYLEEKEDIIVELDPGMAFGTGTHPTTSLCVRALESTVKPGSVVYDIGTGSGVLAIAAAKLGAKVKAVDLDPVAVRVARENVANNHLTERIQVEHGNLADVLTGSADVVVANIIADIIIVLAEDLERILRPGGVCLASGIISERQQDVVNALETKGLLIEQVDDEKGWVLIRARRRPYAPV